MKEVQRQLRTLKPYLFSEEGQGTVQPVPGSSIRDNFVNAKTDVYDNKDSSSEEEVSDVESEAAVEGEVKPVKKAPKIISYLNKLTKTERNAKLLRKLRHQEQEYQREVKDWNK